jgi:hypothetical protein
MGLAFRLGSVLSRSQVLAILGTQRPRYSKIGSLPLSLLSLAGAALRRAVVLEPRKSVVGKPPRRAAMEMITLPGTTLRVSRICLGTQQFSDNWEWPME